MNFLAPLVREIVLSFGMASASANSLAKLLNHSNDANDELNRTDGCTSNAVALMVGGAEESFYTRADSYRFVLKNRKGFIRIALETGASLVPAISFGENNVYELVDFKSGSSGWFLQHTIKRYTKFAPIIFNGRGFLQYNYGLIPKRHPITTVVGAPIHLEKTSNPSDFEIDRIHKLFCQQLNELFETHKRKYIEHSESIHLELI